MSSPLSYSRTGDATVVNFSQPNFLDESIIQEIQDGLDAVIKSDADRYLILNLSAVRFVSSRFLGLLAKLSGLRRGGSKIALAGLQENLREPFRITRLDRRFDFFASVEDALASLDQYPVIDTLEG